MARQKKSTVAKIVKSIVNAPDISIFNDATNLQTLITQYEQMLANLKALISKESATIKSAGYTAIVQAAITVHTNRIAQLKAKLAGTGGVSASDISYLVSQYTSQLDSYAYLGKQLCTGGYVDELATLLPKYQSVLTSLITLNTNSSAAIVASGYKPIVTGSISLHTAEIATLKRCVPGDITIPSSGIIKNVRVDAIVDGDTLTVDLPQSVVGDGESRINIRLAGCNAPEKPETSTQAGKSVLEYTYDRVSSFMYVDKSFYSQATMKLGTLVGAQVVTLKMNKSKPFDSYGRLVAVVVKSDGTVANEQMLSAGLCAYFHRSEWSSADDPVDHSKYIALESAAKVAKLGVWVTPTSVNKTGQCIITAARTTTTGGTVSTTALVYVDDIYMGMTDTTTPYTLTVGSHVIRVVSSQYGTGSSTITITENGMTTVNVKIGTTNSDPTDTTEKGTVTFQALRLSAAAEYIGTSAEVWENNKYKFIVEFTKDNVSTEVGEHTYVFKKDGYTDKTVTVEVTAGENTLAKAIMVQSTSGTTDPTTQGSLDFISNPSGAKIYIDDNYIGLTKKTSYALSPGAYTIWIKKAGYVDYTETILVEAGKKGIVDATLSTSTGSTEDPTTTKQTGTLDFVTSPTGAYIYVNGVYIGMTKKAGYKLAAGVYLVTFRKNGYDEWEDTVGVTANERLAVEATLKLSDTSTAKEEEEEEDESSTETVNWYSIANPAYQSTQTSYEQPTTTEIPGATSEVSPATRTPTEEDEGMPVQIIVLQEDPDKEKLTKVFKEVKAFFKKYCDTKLKFFGTVHEPIETDKDEDDKETLIDVSSMEDQLDMDKVQEDKGIIILLWTPDGSTVAFDGETLTRDEQLNRSIVCSIPMTEDFSKEISGTKKTTLGITSEGALTMVSTMTNALLEWYLDDHEAEDEDEELPEFDKEFCNIKEESKERPTAKCAKKWLKKYNAKIEE